MPRDHAAYAFALALVALLGIISLALLHEPVPGILADIAFGTTDGGLALSKGGR